MEKKEKTGRKGNFWKNWIKLEEWEELKKIDKINKIDEIWNLDFVSLNYPDTC